MAAPAELPMEQEPEERFFSELEYLAMEPYVPEFVDPPTVYRRELNGMDQVGYETFHQEVSVNGVDINLMEGLQLYTDVFTPEEQEVIMKCVIRLRDMGRAGLLMKRTYSEPRKWMKGKGRITIQCGCCYNFATDREGNPPGIIRHDGVDPMPEEIKDMIAKLVRWGILPEDCIPNSCIINIYEKGDCIPPHIDHHDFERPFCTVSFVSESRIVFGKELRITGQGQFEGSAGITLPVGSVLVLQGNGADVAKHCIPGVRERRVSITFRRMREDKFPFEFIPDQDLESLFRIRSEYGQHPGTSKGA